MMLYRMWQKMCEWFYILYILCKNNLSLKGSQESTESPDAGMFLSSAELKTL